MKFCSRSGKSSPAGITPTSEVSFAPRYNTHTTPALFLLIYRTKPLREPAFAPGLYDMLLMPHDKQKENIFKVKGAELSRKRRKRRHLWLCLNLYLHIINAATRELPLDTCRRFVLILTFSSFADRIKRVQNDVAGLAANLPRINEIITSSVLLSDTLRSIRASDK